MPMRTLAQSRWAVPEREPEPAISSSKSKSNAASPEKASQELARFMKIVSRLKWKLPFLSEGYHLATSTTSSPADVAHAEIMFKIDFHEYYALLERAIVHLLAVFDIVVDSSRWYKGPSDNIVNGGGNANHRYHANVLEALEKKSCPLYPFLGSGPVRDQLRRAKQLRNQWKTADSTDEEDGQQQQKMALESYDLEGILMAIFAGLEEAHALAEKYVAKAESEMEVETEKNGNIPSPPSTGADWDFIVDAMDWEAV